MRPRGTACQAATRADLRRFGSALGRCRRLPRGGRGQAGEETGQMEPVASRAVIEVEVFRFANRDPTLPRWRAAGVQDTALQTRIG